MSTKQEIINYLTKAIEPLTDVKLLDQGNCIRLKVMYPGRDYYQSFLYVYFTTPGCIRLEPEYMDTRATSYNKLSRALYKRLDLILTLVEGRIERKQADYDAYVARIEAAKEKAEAFNAEYNNAFVINEAHLQLEMQGTLFDVDMEEKTVNIQSGHWSDTVKIPIHLAIDLRDQLRTYALLE